MVVGAWLLGNIIADLLRKEAGVDVIAVLAIGGALALGEALTAAVIAVMLATGEWLERYAEGRAHRELSALSRAPPASCTATRTAGSRTGRSARWPSATGSW